MSSDRACLKGETEAEVGGTRTRGGVGQPRRRGLHRREQRRRFVWLLAATGLAVVLAGGTLAGVVWGRPRLIWRLQRSDNHLLVTLVRGGGPFAARLLSGSTLQVGHHRRRLLVLTVPAGRTIHMTAEVSSLWSTSVPLIVHVPPKPALIGTSVTARSVTLRFSMPVTVANTACGMSRPVSRVTALTVDRGTVACSGTVHLVSASGEQASASFSVPALPAPPPTPLPPGTPANLIFFGPADGGAFYITIDDGIDPDPRVLDLMRSQHVPITAFLISTVAARHLDYWRAFLAAGGDIEDHTVSHPALTKLSSGAVEMQWAGAAQAFHQWFGITLALGRPPYGTVSRTVRVAAAEAGLRDLILWSASMYNGQLTTYDHQPLRAGEIVILHWIPGLYSSLVRLLAIASAQGLHPAPLAANLAPTG